MTLNLTDLKSVAADVKTGVTVLGALLAAATEVLPVVPSQWQHWVVGFIAVGTVVVRDVTDALSKTQ